MTRENYFCSFGHIDFNLFIPPQVSLLRHFFFGEAIIDQIRSRIVEVEGIHASREECS